MRRRVDAERLRAFVERLGGAARRPARVYLVGGATAVELGWRDATIDIDLKLVPEADELLRAIQELKEELEVNVELASPDLFIPVRSGWEDRSPHVSRAGKVDVHHFDLRAQALAKLERGHARDLGDVDAMLARGLVTKPGLLAELARIEPLLHRYPAVDARAFRAAVEALP